MSWPVDVILTWNSWDELSEASDEPLIQNINQWIDDNFEEKRAAHFHAMPTEFGNGYIGAENVYFGVFNYFSPDELLAHLRTLKWSNPSDVQLMVRDMEASCFELFTLEDYRPDATKSSAEELMANASQSDSAVRCSLSTAS